jgi:hypothetical protein
VSGARSSIATDGKPRRSSDLGELEGKSEMAEGEEGDGTLEEGEKDGVVAEGEVDWGFWGEVMSGKLVVLLVYRD